jgi:hypothetical protein
MVMQGLSHHLKDLEKDIAIMTSVTLTQQKINPL